MTDELLPCPFCGMEAMHRHALWKSEGDTDAIIHAKPSECPLAGGFSIETADEGVSVAAAWNRRAQPVRVKSLEWGTTSYGTPEAHSTAGVYRVFHHIAGGWGVARNRVNLTDAQGRENFGSEAEAIAAAQADYERRILSALEPAPVAEDHIPDAGKMVDPIREIARSNGRLLGELLAIIHGDGGHYQALHGDEKAVEDAIQLVAALRSSPAPVVITDEMVMDALSAWRDHEFDEPAMRDAPRMRLALQAALTPNGGSGDE